MQLINSLWWLQALRIQSSFLTEFVGGAPQANIGKGRVRIILSCMQKKHERLDIFSFMGFCSLHFISFHFFHFIFNSLYRVKTSITKVTALQLALSTKQKPIYNFMSQLTYEKNIE